MYKYFIKVLLTLLITPHSCSFTLKTPDWDNTHLQLL